MTGKRLQSTYNESKEHSVHLTPRDRLQVAAFTSFFRVGMEGKTDTVHSRRDAFEQAIAKSSDDVFDKADPVLIERYFREGA